jgi:hypothetical protein
MAPVPVWAKALALVVAVATAPVMALLVLASAVALASTTATSDRTTSFDVGTAPRLQVTTPVGFLRILAGPEGRVVVDDRSTATAPTRAAAGGVLQQAAVHVSRQGEVVTVRQAAGSGIVPAPNLSEITVRVPIHTDLDVRQSGAEIQGIDGNVRVTGAGSVSLRDVTLRGASTIDVTSGHVELDRVHVAGSAVVRSGNGAVTFDGTLASGGSALDIDVRTGGARIVLPMPTDARAAVATQLGELRADPAWGFKPDSAERPRRWTADLGPDPTGMVTVRAAVGTVEFDVKTPP